MVYHLYCFYEFLIYLLSLDIRFRSLIIYGLPKYIIPMNFYSIIFFQVFYDFIKYKRFIY